MKPPICSRGYMYIQWLKIHIFEVLVGNPNQGPLAYLSVPPLPFLRILTNPDVPVDVSSRKLAAGTPGFVKIRRKGKGGTDK